MLVSRNWLKEFFDFDYSTEKLTEVLTILGIEVDAVIDYKEKYANFYSARVLSCKKHPDADKLTVCRVEFGGEEKQVICGAPNVAAGQKVVLGTVGAVVPEGGFALSKMKIRGVESEGMICSQFELALGDDKSGIWVLPEDAPVGVPLTELMELDDVILDCSITPNRMDCFSHFGIARDIAAYNRKRISLPAVEVPEVSDKTADSVEIEIADVEKCSRYAARIVRGVKIQESPDWLKKRLISLGMRPVNAAVDATNFVLAECGQPLHAFDFDEVAQNKIIVRAAKEGEKFEALDHKKRTLDSDMLMICDPERSIGIAGVMGGANSEIAENTKNILIESAFFNPSSIRRTAKKLGVSSDASYRFERGVDVDNIVYAADRAAKMIAELCGGEVLSGVVDVYPETLEKKRIEVRRKKINQIIGIAIPKKDVREILLAANFEILSEDDEKIVVVAPRYRLDILSGEIDVIEDIARLYGYDKIRPAFESSIDFSVEAVPPELEVNPLKQKIADYLVPRGYFEIITQNQLDPSSAKIFAEDLVEIANPLGEELSIMRPSMIPAALRTVRRNMRVGVDDVRFFEIGRTFHRAEKDEDVFVEGVKERERLIICASGSARTTNWSHEKRYYDFFDMKGLVEDLLDFLRFDFISMKGEPKDPALGGEALEIKYKKRTIGFLGAVSKKLLKIFEVDAPVYIASIDLGELNEAKSRKEKYQKVSPYPGVSRDLAFVVDAGAPAEKIANEISQKGGKFLQNVAMFDLYEGEGVEEGKKSVAYNLYFVSPDKTLVDQEVDQAVTKIVKAVENKFDAKLRR